MNGLARLRREAKMPEDAVAILTRSTCHRCGGLMVLEDCMDLLDDSGEIDFRARRCVQCGEVIDPVILSNRYRRPDPMAPRHQQPGTAVVLSAVSAA